MKHVDVRAIPPPARHPEIFKTFDALPAGDGFVLLNDHYPKPLLFQFMTERPGQFEWSVLQAGPELFRVAVEKRTEPGRRGVGEYMQGDHLRLDRILTRVVDGLEGSDAAAAFAEFACGIERHMQAEEQLLFPAFEQATGMVGGPVAVMNDEHAALRRLLESVSTALADGDIAEARDGLRDVTDVLAQHNMKEEHVIYPRTDHALGERQGDDLVRQMQLL